MKNYFEDIFAGFVVFVLFLVAMMIANTIKYRQTIRTVYIEKPATVDCSREQQLLKRFIREDYIRSVTQ